MNPPLGPALIASSEGSASLEVETIAYIISFLMVRSPMLAKRMMKMAMTMAEMSPPLVVV